MLLRFRAPPYTSRYLFTNDSPSSPRASLVFPRVEFCFYPIVAVNSGYEEHRSDPRCSALHTVHSNLLQGYGTYTWKPRQRSVAGWTPRARIKAVCDCQCWGQLAFLTDRSEHLVRRPECMYNKVASNVTDGTKFESLRKGWIRSWSLDLRGS